MADTGILHLGTFQLDTRSGLLRAADGSETRPRRKLGQLLHLIACNPGRVLTRAELMAVLWPRTAGSDESLTQLVRQARVALRDTDGKLLQTVHGRGYILASSEQAHTRPAPDVTNSFVGRQDQLDSLRALLVAYRLITLTGPGGVGKTRLMTELAATLGPAHRASRVRLDLAPVPDGTDLPILLASQLGLSTARNEAADAVVKAWRGREILLLVDNAEHLLPPLVVFLQLLLAECPGLRVLVTSRVSLAIPEERVFRLAPLAVPPADVASMADALAYGATRLLADRAMAQVAGFDPAVQDPEIMAAICRQLDGLAFAIELAASMLPALSPVQLLKRLRTRLHLQAPVTGATPIRQHSLTAMLTWSWKLLTPVERDLLQVVAVFAGSAPLDAVAEVAGLEAWQALDGVAALVRASLVVPIPGSGEPRFTMLETARAFALEQAGAARDALHRRHLDVVLRSLRAALRDWPTMASAEWRLRHDVDAPNLRAALQWAFGPGCETAKAVDLASMAHRFWLELDELPLREARHWLVRAAQLAGPDTPQAVLASLDLGLSWPDDQLGDLTTLPAALRAAERFRDLGDLIGTGAALWRAGCAVLVVETIDQAAAFLAQAERALRCGPATKWLVLTLVRQASVQVLTRQDDLALATYQEALLLARALKYPYGAMLCGHSAGDHLFSMNRREEALSLLTTLRDELPRGLRSQLVSTLSTQLTAVGRNVEATEAIAEILDATPVSGLSATLARGLETLAMFIGEEGDPDSAALLFGHVLTVHPVQRQRSGGRKVVHDRLMAVLRATHSTSLALDAQLAKGARMSELQALELARSKLRELRRHLGA